jgi:monoamine oxidase
MSIDAIVIGAGAAGLAAARTLAEAGRSTHIVEARDRIGGRVWTQPLDGFPLPVEVGAEFVHGRPPATWDALQEAGLVAYDVGGDWWRRRGRHLRRAGERDDPNAVMSRLKIRRTDESFADALLANADRMPRADLALARSFVEGFDAAHVELVSARSIAQEQEGLGNVGEEPQSRVLQGYGALVEWLRDGALRVGATLRLSWPVRSIRWERGKVTVSGLQGSLRASAAIVTLPVGVLQHSDVELEPDVPRIRSAVSLLGAGSATKVVLAFRESFWERGVPRAKRDFAGFGFLFDPSGPLPTWWSSLPLRVPVLTGWAGGPKSDALSGLVEGEVIDRAIASLAELSGVPERRLASMLVAGRCHDWQSDPWSRGAYSYVRVGGARARGDLARPVEGTLFFAGEAADTGDQASTVAGAIASGRAAAKAALRALSSRRPSRRS